MDMGMNVGMGTGRGMIPGTAQACVPRVLGIYYTIR